MVEYCIALVELDGPSELLIGMGVVLKAIVNHTFGVVDRREVRVGSDELLKVVHGLFVLLLPLIVQPNVVEGAHVDWVKSQRAEVVVLFLINVS